jgi:hypothetical protein
VSGRISDPARAQINLINTDHVAKGYAEIQTIELDELVTSFVEVFEQFYTGDIGAFNDLVHHYLVDGQGRPDKPVLHELFVRMGPKPKTVAAARRSFANLVVAADFAATPFRRLENHVGVIETWVLAACAILMHAQSKSLKHSEYRPSMDLCRSAIEDAGARLVDEVLRRDNMFEGDFLADALFLPYRRLLVLGYAGATINSLKVLGSNVREHAVELLEVTKREIPLASWGEASWNYYLNLCIAISQFPEGLRLAEALIVDWISTTCSQKTMKDPYWTLEEELSLTPGSQVRQERRKLSYSAMSAVGFLVRRLRRRAVSTLWPSFSKYEMARMVPEKPWDALAWSMEEGHLEVRRLPIAGSWSALQIEASRHRLSLFDHEPWLLPFYLCVFPHRVTPELSGSLDYWVSDESFRSTWQNPE